MHSHQCSADFRRRGSNQQQQKPSHECGCLEIQDPNNSVGSGNAMAKTPTTMSRSISKTVRGRQFICGFLLGFGIFLVLLGAWLVITGITAGNRQDVGNLEWWWVKSALSPATKNTISPKFFAVVNFKESSLEEFPDVAIQGDSVEVVYEADADLVSEDEAEESTKPSADESEDSKPKLILFWSTLFRDTDNWNGFYDFEGNLKLCKRKCTWTTDRSRIEEADLVMFSIYGRDTKEDDVPETRRFDQLWAVFSHESPDNVGRNKTSYDRWNGLFNLTIVGRLDADVPAVHGKIMHKDHADPQVRWAEDIGMYPDMTAKNKRGAAVISNCEDTSLRKELIAEINKVFPIDVFGSCGNYSCAPGKSTTFCFDDISEQYSFFMAFENSLCKDYVTEKFFRAVLYPWIPVVWSGGNYETIAPAKSYVDARVFDSPGELGQFLHFLADNPDEYLKYFDWKKSHVVSAPGTTFICDICDKVHEPDADYRPEAAYDDLYAWWDYGSRCVHKPDYAAGEEAAALFRGSTEFMQYVRDLAMNP